MIRDLYLPAIVIFLVTIFVIEMIIYAWRTYRNPDRPKIKKRLKGIYEGDWGDEPPDIVKRRTLSGIPALNAILLRVTSLERLDMLLYQANTSYPLGFYVLLSFTLGVLGYLIGLRFLHNNVFAILIAICMFILPFLQVYLKKRERMSKFERQLPEGLGLIGRSLRAGHAFSTGLKLAADEFDDPLGTEFHLCIEQINFGVSVPEALKNLAGRVDCPDLRFFVIAVILQRETGGNLADIIDNICDIIRERYRLKDKIRVLAAEGKISMYILVALPFLLFLYFSFSNPHYIDMLIGDRIGQVMIVAAAVLMVAGIIVMKRMIDIKV